MDKNPKMSTNDVPKRLTSTQRLNSLESKIESISAKVDRIDGLANSVDTLLGKLATLDTANVASTSKGETPKEIYRYETPERSNESMSAIKATNIEKEQPANNDGIFKILLACPINKVKVHRPHVKQDGTQGKSYILEFPRIDENFALVNKEGTTLAQQKAEAKAIWKQVARSGFTFTGKYFNKKSGKIEWTTYIVTKNEQPFLEWLSKQGVHIPERDTPTKDKTDGVN